MKKIWGLVFEVDPVDKNKLGSWWLGECYESQEDAIEFVKREFPNFICVSSNSCIHYTGILEKPIDWYKKPLGERGDKLDIYIDFSYLYEPKGS